MVPPIRMYIPIGFANGPLSRRKPQASYFAKLKAKAQHSLSATIRSGHYFVSPLLTASGIYQKSPLAEAFLINGARYYAIIGLISMMILSF